MRVLKQHMAGGTIRPLIVGEVKRVLAKFAGDPMIYERSGVELGISPKTLRNWLQPVDKGGWPELQEKVDSLDRILGPEKKKPAPKKKAKAKGKMPPPKKKGGSGGKPPLTLVR